MKKFWINFEQFLVLSLMWVIVYSYIALFFVPLIGATGYFIIVLLTARGFMLKTHSIRYYWIHPEECPTVYWCEKLTKRLFTNGKYRKYRKN